MAPQRLLLWAALIPDGQVAATGATNVQEQPTDDRDELSEEPLLEETADAGCSDGSIWGRLPAACCLFSARETGPRVQGAPRAGKGGE